MFIVVEGPDGSGKSSLVEELVKQSSAKYPEREIVHFHMGRPEEESREWCLRTWVGSIEKINHHDSKVVISDRWHWGEVTYAPLKRPHTCKDEYGLLGIAGWRFVELALLSRAAVQFVVKQPPHVLAERIGVRGDEFVKEDELAKICELYDLGIQQAARVEIVSPPANSRDQIPDVVDWMLRTALYRERETEVLPMFPEYIGPAKPSALLVGDRRNGEDYTTLPFYPINGNSGEYLLSNLPSPYWKNIGVINGSEICGGRLHLLWQALGNPRVVALGRLAEKSIKKDSIPADKVSVLPHPQYVRRFHHKDAAEYGQAIKRLSIATNQEDRWILR